MKRGGSSLLVTSFAVAQTVVASYYAEIMQQPQVTEKEENGANGKKEKQNDERFTPRLDGLRFIETLVTAHR